MINRKRWYLKCGDTVKGPFPVAVMERNIVLGRVKPDDLLSQDGESWVSAQCIPEFELISAPVRCEKDFAYADERRAERRHLAVSDARASTIRQTGNDRRSAEPAEIVARRVLSDRIWLGLGKRRSDSQFVWPALAIVVLGIIGLSVLTTPARLDPGDCASGPAPGVNWESCNWASADLRHADMRGAIARDAHLESSDLAGANLTGADLAYADLRRANLESADLGASRLIGANLREANLNHANLHSADLQFADLRAARLDGADLSGALLGNTIWVSGAQCSRDSVGICLSD